MSMLIESNNQLRLDQRVWVKAWWTRPAGTTVRCRVVEIFKTCDYMLTVEPEEGGNRHRRCVEIADILSVG